MTVWEQVRETQGMIGGNMGTSLWTLILEIEYNTRPRTPPRPAPSVLGLFFEPHGLPRPRLFFAACSAIIETGLLKKLNDDKDQNVCYYYLSQVSFTTRTPVLKVCSVSSRPGQFCRLSSTTGIALILSSVISKTDPWERVEVVSMVEAVLSLLAARNVARTLSSVIGRTLW